ncbi:MAG: fumarate hydratase C-terminal domain-containing protein [Deltaproteobacteria bacterium]|nr:fumarate hydratase C-terminal domain-containing protein [Deltaproteobacteria bacterium]
MVEFAYQEMFPLGEDTTEYRRLTKDHISLTSFEGVDVLKIDAQGLTLLAEEAFKDVSHLYRPSHLLLLEKILKDPESSENDRFVALEMLKNAVISAEGVFPMCQDTGTAVVIGNNLPAQIELYATKGDAYHFLFMAKGGGSANKTFLYQETKATLTPDRLIPFMKNKMKTLGTAACPPYHLAFVVGGTSAEMNLKTVKLASAGYLDHLPTSGNERGQAFRDVALEAKLLEESRQLGIGAQFGGKYFCHDIRVVRLPRHGASCPIGVGASCSADRNIKAKITKRGIFLERLETDPSKYLPEPDVADGKAIRVDLNQSMDDMRDLLSQYPIATPLRLTGNIVVARDIAHAKLKERLDSGNDLPGYFKDHIIYYAGPAKTPKGYPSGSFGPTTAGRMDPYVPIFQARGASMVMLAKGNRSKEVVQACKEFGGFYLGSIGGPAARLGKECITSVETLAFGELGMEAIFMITVKDFPAFIIIDDKGNDFFENLLN